MVKLLLMSIFGELNIQGTMFLYIRLFFFIIFSNFIGLFPYIFTRTRHISLTLTIALPLWLGKMILSIIFQYNNLLCHLVPIGTPRFLMPIIVIIESVRNIIRPLTLSIRLAANIVAGHLLLTLLGSQAPNLNMISLSILFIRLYLLLILEVAVACIQSYVFTILNSLYLNELIGLRSNAAGNVEHSSLRLRTLDPAGVRQRFHLPPIRVGHHERGHKIQVHRGRRHRDHDLSRHRLPHSYPTP